MKERKEIKLSHPKKGTILLHIDDVRLPKRIRDSLHEVKDSRFNYHDFNIDQAGEKLAGKPLFFEWQRIDILFSINNDHDFKPPFHFFINKAKIFTSSPINERQQLHGSFNLKNAVGYTTLLIQDSRGEEVFKLDTEVYPQKLEYKEDFQQMIYEITKIIYNLIYDYLQKTYANTQLTNQRSASLVEWRAILEVLFNVLEKSLDHIIKHPKSEIKSTTHVREVSRVKRTSRGVQKWILKNQRYLNQNTGEGLLVTKGTYCSHLPETRKQVSYNTFENRFVVWAVKQILSKLEDLNKFLRKTASNPNKIEQELKTLKTYRQRLRRRLSASVFRDVEEFENQFHFSTVLTMASGYKDFYHKYLLLRKALSVFEDDQFKMDYKDIATLYEYWCFLKIVHILKENPKYNLVSNDLIRVHGSKFIVSLKQGKESKFVFEEKDTKEKYHLYFNRSFTSKDYTYTFTQRPDYSIQFKKEGYENPFWFVLDAKYRFNKKDDKENNKSSYDAPDDAIGQLHRYRDAILHQISKDMTYRSAIKNLGGLILYPYPLDEEKFERDNKYFKSIEQVNIGAIPLAPGKDKLLKTFLDKLFSTSPESHYEQFRDYDKSDYETFLKDLESTCIIGLIKEEDFENRKEFYLSEGLYNVRFVKNTNAAIYKARYICLYSPGAKKIIGYSPIENISISNKEELIQYGANWELSQDQYILLKFDTQDWRKLNLPFNGKSLIRGYRYTNLFALKEYISSGNINAMNLNDFLSIRLWRELKVRPHISFEISRGRSFLQGRVLIKRP
jgi:predicted component of viral defense system (DUF524 family)